ncbi:MAG TPA: hypothetical protein VEL06_04525 [Haliangiales bacterium]|nr:hypothetical protein [Haliangiales bacterium]
MKRRILSTLAVLACMAVSGGTAYAWNVSGNVSCPNGNIFKNVIINVAGPGCNFTGSGVTDSEGNYLVELPECAGTYTATIDISSLPNGATVTSPTSVDFVITDTDFIATVNFEIGGDACAGVCWFTGGGAKIDQLLGLPAAHRQTKSTGGTPDLAFGGNVYPGCSSTAGDGGNWNHVDRIRNLHFRGTTIQVVDCGNVSGIPPGSTSPVTPYNFIEFTGTGNLKGIQGNKANYDLVYFYARGEDRNEPGSKGANDGALIDRYYLRVYTNPVDPAGSTLLLVGGPNPADTVPITDGNFQIHVSSCDNPPAP